MRIAWNSVERTWQLEFSSDFQGDLAAAKAAKFRTTGPPSWIWHTDKIKILRALQANRPASGLTISTEALEQFTEQSCQQDRIDRLKKEFDDDRARAEGKPTSDEKAAKKAEREQKRLASGKPPRSKIKKRPAARYSDPEGIKFDVRYIPREKFPVPTLLCHFCKDPIYDPFDRTVPPVCLWCEKIVLDLQRDFDILLDRS